MAEMNADGFLVRSSANRSALRSNALHGGHERRRIARERESEPVGAPFVRARHRVRHRHHHQRYRARREQEQRKAGDIRDSSELQRCDERAEHSRREIEAGQNQHALESNPLPDVAVDVVRQLVRQHHFDFLI
jgi:hypothetical protein